MEVVIAAAVAAVAPTIAALASWRDMRKRTNGQGPIAGVLHEHSERLGRIEDRTARTEERVARIESRVIAGAVADRAEEKRVARRENER